LTTPPSSPTATEPVARLRPARAPRRALDDLGLPIEAANIEAIAADEPDWLAADRRSALAAFQSLPGESNRLYTPYIDLRAARLADARIVTEVGTERASGTHPAEADGLIEIHEGRVVTVELSETASEAGVVLRSIVDDLDLVRDRLFDGGVLPVADRYAQLTRAAWTQGIQLEIPAGVRLERPIVIRWAVGAPDRALLTRTLVRLGAEAEAALVEELVGSDETPDPAADGAGQAFLSGTFEVELGAGAALRVASLQELPGSVVAIQHRHAEIDEGATLQWALAQLGGRLVRSRIDNRLVGDRSSVEQVEIVFGADEQLFDLTSYTTHVGRDTTGDLLSKGALLDKARTYMKGLIRIEKSAVGTNSFLGEFGMNLSKAARSVAIPSLEIDQPDCRRAAHSSSVGPIDETQLFYLESRGIPPDEARKFIVLGFLEPVVARVPLASAQERLRTALEEKWVAGAGDDAGAAA
jgi:Fe-S cluster assembly scaffold protein SufB